MAWEFFKKLLIFAPAGSVVRRISWLTVVGLALSVSCLIVVLSVMTALNQNLKARTLAVEPHLVVESAPGLKPLVDLPAHLQKNLNGKVQPFERQDVIVRTTDGKFRGAEARGMSDQSLKVFLAEINRLSAKTHFPTVDSEAQVTLGKGEILMGGDLAHLLGVYEGQEVMLVAPEGLLLPPSEAPRFEKVKVKRIINTNVSDIDAQVIFYGYRKTLNSMKDSPSRQSGLEVKLNTPEDAASIKKKWSKEKTLVVETWEEKNSALFLALFLEKTMMALFLGIAAFVAGLSLISVLSLVISQRKKEIAILQTIGLSKRNTRNLFFKMGGFLGALGIVLGLVVGLSLSLYLEKHPLNILPDIYYDSQVPALVSMPSVFVIAIVSLGFALLAAWYVSSSATDVSTDAKPVEGLR